MTNDNNEYSLEELLKSDNELQIEYRDELIVSNLFFTSFSTSLRELETRFKKCIEYIDTLPVGFSNVFSKKEVSDMITKIYIFLATDIDKCRLLVEECQFKICIKKGLFVIDNFIDCVSKNLWIKSNISINIGALNFDALKNRLNIVDAQSMDALILNYDEKRNNSLIEFKRCDKSYLLKKFLNPKNVKEKDSIYQKVSCSRNILRSINIDGYDHSTDIIKHTYIIIVYDKNDTLSKFTYCPLEKRFASRDQEDKQRYATSRNINKKARPSRFNLNPHPNKTSSVCDDFGKQMKATNHISSKDYNEYIADFEKFVKSKGFGCCLVEKRLKNAKKSVLLWGEADFSTAAENGRMGSSNWGIYSPYII